MLNEKRIADHKSQYKYGFDALLRSYMVRTLQPFFRSGTACELGCYQGDFTRLIMPFFDKIYAVDNDQEALKVATQEVNNKVELVCQDFNQLQLPETVEQIFMVHSFEHVEHRLALLEHLKTQLKPRGQVIIVVPNAQAASRQIASAMGVVDYNSAIAPHEKKHGHFKTFSFDTLTFEIKAAGFSPKQSGGILFKPLANYQFDLCLQHKIIEEDFLDGCYQLGQLYPQLCASLYTIAELTE